MNKIIEDPLEPDSDDAKERQFQIPIWAGLIIVGVLIGIVIWLMFILVG